MLASVACQAAFAVENAQLHETLLREQALKRELSVAHEVLRGFLPAASPRIEDYDFFAFYEPANQLGGDYYDYIPLPGGRLGVVVADVSGKGIPASLLMARLSADARYCLASEPNARRGGRPANHVFCTAGWEDRFVTLVLAVLDPPPARSHPGQRRAPPPRCCAAPPGKIEPVAEAEIHLPLGVDKNVKYVQHTLPLAAGRLLTLYTDGITEAMNDDDELYGLERLRSQLGSPARGSTARAADLDDVKHFVGLRPQSDDMCLVCFGRKAEDGAGEEKG